ncbi:hypothetical protein ACFWGN_17840 [Oerskovia sp. NPDC060338]|uniref:hypothetical protein n=1 Tax=Oerskovia sp. NPDC060338 TaxID=3347100 RepID=UPI00364901CA
MGRLVNARTGVIVNVDDETAQGLGPEWRDAEETKAADGELAVPRGNARAEVWAAYAEALGVEVPEGAKRDAIKTAIAAATEDADDDLGDEGDHVDADNDLGDEDDEGDGDQDDEDTDEGDTPAVATETDW